MKEKNKAQSKSNLIEITLVNEDESEASAEGPSLLGVLSTHIKQKALDQKEYLLKHGLVGKVADYCRYDEN